jgi:hypothetical protein
MTDDRLPLANPAWATMSSYALDPARIPFELGALRDDPQHRFDELFPLIFDSVFNQGSISLSAYAAFPYLVDAYAALRERDPEAMVLLAQIAASAQRDETQLPAGISQAFHNALTIMEAFAVKVLAQLSGSVDDLYYTTLSAIAFSGHCCGRLLSDLLEPAGPAWTLIICPTCSKATKVTLFADGAVAWTGDDEPNPPRLPQPLGRLIAFEPAPREPNPWAELEPILDRAAQSVQPGSATFQRVEAARQLCHRGINPDVPPDHVLSLIGVLFIGHGYTDEAIRFLRFTDEVECPNCKVRVRVADAWWGCRQ